MLHRLVPGDRVRVAAVTSYEPLARRIRERESTEGFVIEEVVEQSLYGGGSMVVVKVRYPDGKFSGAINAEIFERISQQQGAMPLVIS